jgi:hypothetical protein
LGFGCHKERVRLAINPLLETGLVYEPVNGGKKTLLWHAAADRLRV